MDKARYTAVCALMRQEKNGYSNLVLDGMLEKSQLPPRDRAFASMLFYGTLEHLLTLDACLSACLQKPLTKLDPQVRAVLREVTDDPDLKNRALALEQARLQQGRG